MLILLEVGTRASQGEVKQQHQILPVARFRVEWSDPVHKACHCEKVGLFPTTQAMRLMAIIGPLVKYYPLISYSHGASI